MRKKKSGLTVYVLLVLLMEYSKIQIYQLNHFMGAAHFQLSSLSMQGEYLKGDQLGRKEVCF